MILFLDFDGVLHPMKSGFLFEQSHRIRELLIRHQHLQLVIHSSWRMCSQYSEDDLWGFLEIEDSMRHRYLGITPISEPSRWESIKVWIKENSYVGEYVILDDMRSSFDDVGRERLISPFGLVGMQECDWQELEQKINANLQS